MPLVEEVLLGAALGALVQAIFIAKEKATFFKKTLEHLESTLQSVSPIVEQVNKSENCPTDTLSRFVEQLEKAKVLVDMYSDIRKWKFLKKRKVKKLILAMDASLQKFLTQDFQVEQLVYLTIIDKDVIEMNKKMDHIITLLEGDRDFAMPEPATKETLSSLENNESDDKQSSPAFEFHWKMSKDKCLDICFWRHASDEKM